MKEAAGGGMGLGWEPIDAATSQMMIGTATDH
jgi:hypothetical protein